MESRALPKTEIIEEFIELTPAHLREIVRAEVLAAREQGAGRWSAIGRRPVQTSFLERTSLDD